ncbi:hypothetical protein GCM10011585_31420 [Edaphobacter dinghuensis]|uniref:Uncharacterized protein n=2 Tax=Edaphobacter dinghuensis TaxID=1560005 RepID=A0A917HNN2_9BACT|nr:hypothetical protein GCM10011585_31420 [Edaphobacter dinghuensis]
MLHCVPWAALGIAGFALASMPARAQQDHVVVQMAANEKAARAQEHHFTYISEERSSRTGGHLWKEKAVETDDGVLRRLLSVDGRSLTPAQTQAEEQRIEGIVAHPEAFRKLNANHYDDEVKATQLLEILPKAFLISSAGEENACTRFSFRPNPAFQPSTYEERVIHVLEGTVSIKEPEDRLCKLEARITQPVEFGFGLLGKVNSGGHFELERAQVDPQNWKSVHISVHVDARILLLKSITRDQETTRTAIHIVPQHLSLADAARLTRP